MDDRERAVRESFIERGRSFTGTPYQMGGMLKGVAADCATFLAMVLIEQGLMPPEDISGFQHDWWVHGKEELYAKRMLRHSVKIAETICSRSVVADPGNIVLCRTPTSRIFSHGGLITNWPMVLECIEPCVQETDVSRSPLWELSNIAIFDPFAGKMSVDAG